MEFQPITVGDPIEKCDKQSEELMASDKDAIEFALEAIRINLGMYHYKNEVILMEAFKRLRKAARYLSELKDEEIRLGARVKSFVTGRLGKIVALEYTDRGDDPLWITIGWDTQESNPFTGFDKNDTSCNERSLFDKVRVID